jgi:hypothetical protein
MLTKSELKALRQEFPEGIPAWMLGRGYTADKIRELMKARQKSASSPIDGTEHDFSGSLEDWEDRVFDAAAYFTVVKGRSPFTRERFTCGTFPQALEVCTKLQIDQTGGPMIYAVTASGRHVMLVPEKWSYYLTRWVANRRREP